MQPAAPSPLAPPVWLYVVGGLLLVFGVLFFFQTRDPMILMFGVMAAGTLAFVVILVQVVSRAGAGAAPRVMVRCPSCQALNAEESKFCGQCGRAV